MTESTDTVKKTTQNKTLVIIVAVVIVLAVAGYALKAVSNKASQMVGEKVTEKMIESAAGGNADVDIKDDGMTITTDKGTFTAGTELPADWPNDVPAYTGATVTYSGSSNADEGTGYSAVFSTKDDYTKVAAYYTNELPKQGWAIESTQNITGTTVMAATKDTRTISVAASTTDGETSITIGVASNN